MVLTVIDSLYPGTEKRTFENFEGPGFGNIFGKYKYIVSVNSMYDCSPHPLVDEALLSTSIYDTYRPTITFKRMIEIQM